MKKDIHPEFFQSKVVCGGCGNSFVVGAVKPEINISICSNCHPFYTGSQAVVDTEGRIDKFKAKYAKFSQKSA